eukprot:jgi/Botrbrau1/23557/Bobra.0141s0028.1
MHIRRCLGRTAGRFLESVNEGVVTQGNPVRCSLFQSCQSRSGSALTTTKPPQTSLAAKSLLVDTLGLFRAFERIGLSREQSEAMTETLTDLVCANRDKMAEIFATKVALEKAILEQEARIAGFKSEVVKGQELHLASLTRDTERLSNSLEKIRSEIKYEIDKLSSMQRLDLNLEKGRMRDDMQVLRDKANELEIKMDKETNMLKAAVETTKNETIKYCLGMMLAFTTAGLGAARLFSK